jgi:hypothetical protein
VNEKNRGAGKARRGADSQTAAVGYGRPPLASRFKPGMSGNPKGRPKGCKNLKALIREAMTASISIQEGQKARRVSRLEGVVLRQLQSALRGNDKAALAVIKMALQLQFLEEPAGAAGDNVLSNEDERILAELVARSRMDK